MKISVSSYSFHQLAQSGELGLPGIIEKTREMGFDGIEFSSYAIPEEETPQRYAEMLKKACDAAGLPVVNYTIGADFINGSNGDFKAEVKRLKEEVLIAEILGASGMRHDATRGFPDDHEGGRSFADALPRLVEGCREVTVFAAEHGVRTMVENHGFFCQDSERVERLISGVSHANFGALIDMGNFLCADEHPGLAVGRLAPSAFHVHAKDFHVKSGTDTDPGQGWFRSRGGNLLRGSIIGHGNVPVIQCLHILKRAGYEGYLSIEFEGLEEPLRGIEYGLANLRRYAREVWGG